MAKVEGKVVRFILLPLALFSFYGSQVAAAAIAQPPQSLATNFNLENVVVQLGGYQGIQGQSQHINIPTLIGDDFSVNNRHNGNVLIGLGYYFDGQTWPAYQVSYGLNLFYLPQVEVNGNVTQEGVFTNLSYQYNMSNLPIYAIVKGIFNTASTNYDIAIDAGIGPNFMSLTGFKEMPLTSFSVSDHPFKNATDVTLSATLGLNVRMKHLVPAHIVECGYRFFYLGEGHLSHTMEVSSSLSTGNTFANALICSLTL
jgi:hypothetical protein